MQSGTSFLSVDENAPRISMMEASSHDFLKFFELRWKITSEMENSITYTESSC
jgi:hypothetical protein